MAEFDYETLRKKINNSCIQLFDGTPWCRLCFAQLPFRSQYNSHTNGATHAKNSNVVYSQLVQEFSSSGIVLLEDKIYCILCEEDVGSRFNKEFRGHLRQYNHERWVDIMEVELKKNDFETYYDECFSGYSYHDEFIEKITRAGSYVTKYGELYCWLCKCRLPGESQFRSHTSGSSHLTEVVQQLTRLVDKAGLSVGIVVQDGSFVCELCNALLGEVNLDNIYRVYNHLNTADHKGKVWKQDASRYYDDQES